MLLKERNLVSVQFKWPELGGRAFGLPQVAQARNISIDEHRHCCITFEI